MEEMKFILTQLCPAEEAAQICAVKFSNFIFDTFLRYCIYFSGYSGKYQLTICVIKISVEFDIHKNTLLYLSGLALQLHIIVEKNRNYAQRSKQTKEV